MQVRGSRCAVWGSFQGSKGTSSKEDRESMKTLGAHSKDVQTSCCTLAQTCSCLSDTIGQMVPGTNHKSPVQSLLGEGHMFNQPRLLSKGHFKVLMF